MHALGLHTQHHHHVCIGDLAVEVVAHAHAVRFRTPVLNTQRHQRRGCHEHHLRSEGREQLRIRAGHAGVQDIPDDHYLFAANLPDAVAHRGGVQKSLGGVLVGTVTCVDDGRIVQPTGYLASRAGGRVAHDDRVGAHGLQGQRGITQ